jgi:hypothetical protein
VQTKSSCGERSIDEQITGSKNILYGKLEYEIKLMTMKGIAGSSRRVLKRTINGRKEIVGKDRVGVNLCKIIEGSQVH